jgi:hypothetical protein
VRGCPWHALVGKASDDLGPEADARRVLVVQQIDHMTSKEQYWPSPTSSFELPAHYGVTCKVEMNAPRAAAASRAVSVTCSQHGRESRMERSCADGDARVVKGWDAYDRMGVNILSVLLVCVPPELIPK